LRIGKEKSEKFGEWISHNERHQGKGAIIDIKQGNLYEDGTETNTMIISEVEEWSTVKSIAGVSTYRIDGKSLDLVQVNCWSV
jgi:hypothetical protein